MRTFFAVTSYAFLVAALDLGGAVWTSLHTAARPSKPAIVTVETGAAAKTVNAVPASATNPSDT